MASSHFLFGEKTENGPQVMAGNAAFRKWIFHGIKQSIFLLRKANVLKYLLVTIPYPGVVKCRSIWKEA
jgi:hypothetical protein